MGKISAEHKKLVKQLNAQVTVLQEQLVEANKLEGKDSYINVKIHKNQARFKRVTKKDTKDKAVGNFYMEISITSKQEPVFIPLSIASGKKTAGFMYQIEGTGEGSIATANVEVHGEGVSQVAVVTLLYAKIPTGVTASFEVRATIRGSFGKTYKIVFTRINYKLQVSEVRYLQYLKELHSKNIQFA